MQRSSSVSPVQWRNVAVKSPPEAMPRQRSLHVGVSVGDSFYVFGGYDGATRLNDLHRFDFTSGLWTQINPANGMAPSPRDRLAAVSHRNDSIFIWGGYDGSNRVNDLWRFDITRNSWHSVDSIGAVPSPRHSHNAVEFDGKIYVVFGYDGNYRSDISEFNIMRKTWVGIQAKGQIPRARYRSASVVFGGKIFTFGGHDGNRHLDDLSCFDLSNQTWTLIEPIIPIASMGPYSFRTSPCSSTPPCARDSHSAVVHGESIFIFGGSSGLARSDLYEYRVDLNAWIELSPQVAPDGAVSITPASGSDTSPSARPTNPTSDNVDHQTSPNPCARFCHVACVYRDAMYVHAGYDGQSRLSDFKSYSFLDNFVLDLPPPTILDDLKNLVNCPHYSDVKFQLDDGAKVFGHKLILSRCAYFKAMFENDFSESTTNSDSIAIPEISSDVFLLLMTYLYTDEIEAADKLDFLKAMSVFIAADRFGIDRLKRICEQAILLDIAPENACEIFHAADLHAANILRKKSLEFILRHYDVVVKTEAFEELARSNIELALELIRHR